METIGIEFLKPTKFQENQTPMLLPRLSRRNFEEMSAKTADANFLLQKKIEKWFSDKHPEKWLPLYSRVTFSLQPYSEAMAIGDFQNEIV